MKSAKNRRRTKKRGLSKSSAKPRKPERNKNARKKQRQQQPQPPLLTTPTKQTGNVGINGNKQEVFPNVKKPPSTIAENSKSPLQSSQPSPSESSASVSDSSHDIHSLNNTQIRDYQSIMKVTRSTGWLPQGEDWGIVHTENQTCLRVKAEVLDRSLMRKVAEFGLLFPK